MKVWELPKEHYNWESPVTKIFGDIHNEISHQDEEICTYTIKQAIGYKVDKEELIKALQYDRNQYEKGYNDGARETFIEELEKIKAELEELANDEWNIQVCATKGLKCAIEVIDDRISELKGENNE